MDCLRLFVGVLQELHCLLQCWLRLCLLLCYNVYCYYCGVYTEKYAYTEFHLDWLLCE